MDWQEFAQQMAGMSRDLLAQESVASTLEVVTACAVKLVEGCDAAGVMVVRGRTVRSLAPTDQVVVDSDRLQEQLQEGPCFDAARQAGDERIYRIADFTARAKRWPAYVPQARPLGLGSMMGFVLYTDDEELGALNLYSFKPDVFDDASETEGWLLASHAAVAFSNARTQAQMQQAIETRHTIGEAMGILMATRHLTEDQAFDTLRKHSQDHNIKLRDVALRVCSTGGLTLP